MTDNKNKKMTNKELYEKIEATDKSIKSLTRKLGKMDVKMSISDYDLNQLSIKIVARMMNIQTMSEWYEHVSSSDIAEKVMDQRLSMTEEENAIGDVARYMTLMNLFEDKEEYEKCAICKLKLDNINKILEKY